MSNDELKQDMQDPLVQSIQALNEESVPDGLTDRIMNAIATEKGNNVVALTSNKPAKRKWLRYAAAITAVGVITGAVFFNNLSPKTDQWSDAEITMLSQMLGMEEDLTLISYTPEETNPLVDVVGF